jgi:UDP-N-acetylglucosamine--N-acetylmuramyl-(pentapeptide) pyrophosphoryl-undecaprenol N-acetylglucosamine transferase
LGKPLHILFAGGGTGGHLFPALAVAEELQRIRPGTRISFAGTADRIESRVVPRLGYGFTPIWISGFRRRLSLQTVLFPVKLAVSLIQSAALLRRLRPQAVVGTGGYVCGPVVYTASVMGIPTVIQEQNSYPGVTTRLLASRAGRVYITFEETRKHLPRAREVVVSGNPTRGAVGEAGRKEGHAFFGTDPEKPTLLVFGGSLGARSINEAVTGMLPELGAAGVQVLWQTGEQEYERVMQERKGPETGPMVTVLRFIDRMDLAYAAADLVLCRAGATTLAELTRAGLPSVLVPYPHAAADHQTSNARAMVDGGASLMIRDGELREQLPAVLRGLLHDTERRREMGSRARALGRPEAANTIARGVIQLAEPYDAE